MHIYICVYVFPFLFYFEPSEIVGLIRPFLTEIVADRLIRVHTCYNHTTCNKTNHIHEMYEEKYKGVAREQTENQREKLRE